MTRLISEQVASIPAYLGEYDRQFRKITGCTLAEVAATAAGFEPGQLSPGKRRISIIPLSSGLGIIEGFSEAVLAIAQYLGFQAVITAEKDLAGLVEAYRSTVEAIILADDNTYAAINIETGQVCDNDEATAAGFVTALSRMAGGLLGKEVLLIGAGKVGKAAAEKLVQAGAKLLIYDLDHRISEDLAETLVNIHCAAAEATTDLSRAVKRAPLIFDASPAPAIIQADQISRQTLVAAPGVPLGCETAAVKKLGFGLLHDPLQLGTAVMLFKVFCSEIIRGGSE